MTKNRWQGKNMGGSTESECSGSVEPSCQSASVRKLSASVSVYPSMALKAMTNHLGGAYRLWVFARGLDVPGSGGIFESELKAACLASGLHPKSYQRWFKEAIKVGYFTIKIHKNGIEEVRYDGVAIVCNKLGCEQDNRAVYLPTENFIKGNWRNLVWEAFIRVNFQGRIVSRAVLYELTGINRYEQVKLEKGTCIHNEMNVAQTDVPASHLDGVKEYQNPSAFVYDGKVCFRLPDTRSTDAEYKFGSRTRAKIIKQALEEHAGEGNKSISKAMRTGKRWRKKQGILSKEKNPMDAKQVGVPCVSGRIGKERMDNKKSSCIRIFFPTYKKVDRAFRRYSRMDLPINALFYPLNTENSNKKGIREWKLELK